jgi:peptidoglycan/xylan/chitin deacetylase (PgdA/CDA1 family)
MTIWPNTEIVPVLTFHSVGMHEPSWIWQQLSERADAFEDLLRTLKKKGYRTVGLPELYAHMSGQQRCAPKSVALVFDDGYLDNWVTVYPLLKKYGMKGTVYVNPEFVDPGSERRPTLDDLRESRDNMEAISQTGFMNWPELRRLDESGVLDVQSHALTHTWYFSGPAVADFYAPSSASAYPWMAWNARPERKPFYLQEDQSSFVPWGAPVFEFEKSLLATRFTPDRGKVNDVVSAVEARGGAEFFTSPDWRERLQGLVTEIGGGEEFPGEYESRADYEARVRFELQQSKAIIEDKLGKAVEYLCWPGGGTNAVAKEIAAAVGYKSWTLPSSEQRDKRNLPGEDPQEIRRLPALRDVHFFSRAWGVGSARLVYLEMLAHQDSAMFDILRKAYKLGVAAGIAGQRQVMTLCMV